MFVVKKNIETKKRVKSVSTVLDNTLYLQMECKMEFTPYYYFLNERREKPVENAMYSL